MKQIVALVAGVLATGLVQAQADPAKLAQEKACLACHAIDKKLVGPSYKDIAAKYKGNAKAEATLAEKIIKGGSGVWGQVPMPPNTTVKPDEAKILAKWVLSR